MTLGLLGLSALGCGDELPPVERIESTRPLALRTTVQGSAPAGAPERSEAMPFEAVTLTPWFVDAAGPWSTERVGAELDPLWLACNLRPAQGLFGCLSTARPVDPADVPRCPVPDVTDVAGGTVPPTPSPCRISTDTPGEPQYTVPVDPLFLLGGDVEVTMVARANPQGSSRECLATLLEAEGVPGRGCIVMTQRLSVGPDGDLVDLARQVGVPEANLPPAPDPVPEPDTHPRITATRVAVLAAGAPDDAEPLAEFTPSVGATLDAPWGARLAIEIEAPTVDLQTYAVPGDDGTFSPRQEAYSGRWFITWGSLLNPTSNDPIGRNTWELVDDEPPPRNPDGSEPALFLYYVLRDGRQGVTWTWFAVRLQDVPDRP